MRAIKPDRNHHHHPFSCPFSPPFTQGGSYPHSFSFLSPPPTLFLLIQNRAREKKSKKLKNGFCPTPFQDIEGSHFYGKHRGLTADPVIVVAFHLQPRVFRESPG